MKWKILLLDSQGPQNSHVEPIANEELHHTLSHIPHELFFSQNKNTTDAIMNFLKHHTAQLIVALPGKYSFLYRLTHKLIEEALSRNTEKPVLLVKQFL
jgi:hypothetical protein